MWLGLLALATARTVRSPLRLRLPRAHRETAVAPRVRDVDTCFPFRGGYENGCELVSAMCETVKFKPDPLRPSWCGMWTHETFDLWQHCEDEVRLGDTPQAFVDSDQWTAVWDTGTGWATYETACHAVEHGDCNQTEALTLSRSAVPTPAPTPLPPGATPALFPDAPEPDFFVATGGTSGARNFVVDNGHLVQIMEDGTLNRTVNATLNGRGEILWSDAALVSRHDQSPLPGYGPAFVGCFAAQQPPACFSMCEGHSPTGPCHYLCMGLTACRTSCLYGSSSRAQLQGCVNSCLLRDAPVASVPTPEPCPLSGCPVRPVGAPNGLTPQQAQQIEWRLGNMTEQTELNKEILANATLARDAKRAEFRDLLTGKIAEANGPDATTPAPTTTPAPVLNGTNGTNGTMPAAGTTLPPAPTATTTPAPAGEPYQTPAADAAAAALQDEIDEAQAETQAVQTETMAYEHQIAEVHQMVR